VRAVIQRVTSASVTVADEIVGQIDRPGLVVLLGVTHSDTDTDAAWMARKIAGLRIMRDENSISDIAAPVLLVSQFTLYGDATRGRRPTWAKAAPGEIAEPLFDSVRNQLEQLGIDVEIGCFGADMSVTLCNDGPVTVLLESS
jgi:D-tyrosyl-tRNA(Tyr) deacylase